MESGNRSLYEALRDDPDFIKRWFEKVDRFHPSGCWIWTAARSGNGYGSIWFRGKNLVAHVASYWMVRGPVPDGFVVRHTCESPGGLSYGCCYPWHLEVGTKSDNSNDSVKNGTHRPPYSALSEEKAEEIRSLHASGAASRRELARRFGVSEASIRHILKFRSWKPKMPSSSPAPWLFSSSELQDPLQVVEVRSPEAPAGTGASWAQIDESFVEPLGVLR